MHSIGICPPGPVLAQLLLAGATQAAVVVLTCVHDKFLLWQLSVTIGAAPTAEQNQTLLQSELH